MTGGHTNRPERIDAIEQKLDALSSSVRKGFDGVDVAMREQRTYTEFAVGAVEAKLVARFDQVDGRLDQMDGRLDQMDGRLDKMDGRLDNMDGRLDKMDGRFTRLDQKVDQILDLLLPKRPTERPEGQ